MDNLSGFSLLSLKLLYEMKDEETEWVIDNLLPKKGLGLIAAKPKAGKSTLARQMALSVAIGEQFIGRNTSKGTVIYLALEEKKSEVKQHFKILGATGEEEIFIHCSISPPDELNCLQFVINQYDPNLIIIDPLFRFLRVHDSNNYTETTSALEKIYHIARNSNAHILLVHHMGKGEGSSSDKILGSTAIFGAVDTAIILEVKEKDRFISTQQRYGTNLDSSKIEFNPETRSSSLGIKKEEITDQVIHEAMFNLIHNSDLPITEEKIHFSIHGRRETKINILRKLFDEKLIQRNGKGVKGDPFKYYVIK